MYKSPTKLLHPLKALEAILDIVVLISIFPEQHDVFGVFLSIQQVVIVNDLCKL
jgi:hypothetical protein